MINSKNPYFNKVRDFHQLMNGELQTTPIAYKHQEVLYRAGFKLEEIVEFLHAASENDSEFQCGVQSLHRALDQAVEKVARSGPATISLRDQVDALLDLLYFTYGSFVKIGVDPDPIFDLVHAANMGKIFPDGKPHFDPLTQKILKPADWEERFAPEEKIRLELERQQQTTQTLEE